jgi:hypothetical protein
MHAKPDLRVFLKWMIARPGSVITAVIRPEKCFLGFVSCEFLLAQMAN